MAEVDLLKALQDSLDRARRERDEAGRHQRNGHTLELGGCMWLCLQCRHKFDAAVDAELFWCGDDCTGRHPGDRIEQEVNR